jgi:hypothetical protein
MLAIDNTSPSPKFIQAISNPKLGRRAASLISQLQTNHALLNSYLAHFCRVDSTQCPACGVHNETAKHFLLQCPSYAHEREILKRKTDSELTLTLLLASNENVLHLVNYIEATHHFSSKVSET